MTEFNNISYVEDQIPEEIKINIPESKRPQNIKAVKNPVLGYSIDRAVGRSEFRSPEYNLAEIGRVEDTESYVRQSFEKKISLMFKEGWTLVGKNPRTISYIKLRLAQIARASKLPTKQLFRDIGAGLIKKSNVFVIKVRKTESSGGKERITTKLI